MNERMKRLDWGSEPPTARTIDRDKAAYQNEPVGLFLRCYRARMGRETHSHRANGASRGTPIRRAREA
jgi:hypothetical protein